VGCKLSDHILGPDPHQHITFWSRHANTSHPGDVHEFGWFWRYRLLLESAQDVPELGTVSMGNFFSLQRQLYSLSDHFGKPVVMKGIYPAYVREVIDKMLHDQAVWVNVERDPLDCCESIYKVCKVKGVEWFGWYPEKRIYDKIKGWSLRERIAAQVIYFQQFYRDLADVTIDYRDLVTDPSKALKPLGLGKFKRPLPTTALQYSDHAETEKDWDEVYKRVLK